MPGLLDLIAARSPEEAGGLLSDYSGRVLGRLADLLNRPAGFLNDALMDVLPSPQELEANQQRRLNTSLSDLLAQGPSDTDRKLMNFGVAGMTITPVGRIADTAADSAKLADMLQRAGNAKGYHVERSDSAVSPSRYVTFFKEHPETFERINERQVRISNHADKYPELSNGIRTSSDPSTGISFEQAVNWLAREGYPTRLSSKYKDVPTWKQYYANQMAEDQARRSAEALRFQEWQKNFTPTYGDYEITSKIVGSAKKKAYELKDVSGQTHRVMAADIPVHIKTAPDRNVFYEYLVSLLNGK